MTERAAAYAWVGWFGAEARGTSNGRAWQRRNFVIFALGWATMRS